MTQRFALVLAGLPGSGKTTLRHHLMRTYPSLVVISIDDYIEMVAQQSQTPYHEIFETVCDFASQRAETILRNAITEDQNLIIDKVHASRKTRLRLLKDLPARYARICVCVRLDEPTRLARLAARSDKIIPVSAQERMIHQWEAEPPILDEGWDLILSPAELYTLVISSQTGEVAPMGS